MRRGHANLLCIVPIFAKRMTGCDPGSDPNAIHTISKIYISPRTKPTTINIQMQIQIQIQIQIQYTPHPASFSVHHNQSSAKRTTTPPPPAHYTSAKKKSPRFERRSSNCCHVSASTCRVVVVYLTKFSVVSVEARVLKAQTRGGATHHLQSLS